MPADTLSTFDFPRLAINLAPKMTEKIAKLQPKL
jgi:hypothetical protein